MVKMKFILMVCALFFSLPVVSQSTATEQEQGTATVYVYRYKQYTGSALSPSVYSDEGELARIDNGRYFLVKMPAGKHTFRANDKQSGVELELKEGETYYIRVEIVNGFMKGHGRLVLTQKEQGGYEIKKLQPLAADKIKDKSKAFTEEKPETKK